MYLVLAALTLAGAIAIAIRLALATPPWRVLSAGSPVAAKAPPPGDALNHQLASYTPDTAAILGALPPLPAAPMLQGLEPVAPPVIALSLVGVRDDSEAIDRDLWRRAREELSRRSGRRG